MEPRHLAHEGDQIRTFYDGSWGGANSDIQANCEVPMSDLRPLGAGPMQRSAPSMMVPGVEPTQDNSPLALHARRPPATSRASRTLTA